MTAKTWRADITFQLLAGDGRPYGWSDEDCGRIAYVIHQMAKVENAFDIVAESQSIINTYRERAVAVPVDITTGPVAKFEAAVAIRAIEDDYGRVKQYRYGVDAKDNMLIRVTDLIQTTRAMFPGTLANGWLDGRMDLIGFVKTSFQGYAQRGVEGRRNGGHAIGNVYMGKATWIKTE